MIDCMKIEVLQFLTFSLNFSIDMEGFRSRRIQGMSRKFNFLLWCHTFQISLKKFINSQRIIMKLQHTVDCQFNVDK